MPTIPHFITDNMVLSAIVACITVFMGFMKAIEKLTGKKNIANSFWKWIGKAVMFPFNTVTALAKLENQYSKLFDTVIRIEIGMMDIQQTTLAFLDMQEVAYWISNDKGEAVQISKALCEVMGRSEGEIKGNNWSTWLHPNDKYVFDEWLQSIKEKRIFNMDYSYRKNTGQWVKVNGFAVHKLDKNGNYMGSIGRLKVIS